MPVILMALGLLLAGIGMRPRTLLPALAIFLVLTGLAGAMLAALSQRPT